MNIRKSSIIEFTAWLEASDVSLNGFVLENSENAAGIGAIATDDLKVGHCLFRLPKKLCIHQSESDVGKAISGWGLLLSTWTALALTIAYETSKPDSRWSGYLAFLPKVEQKLLNLPLQWSDEELRGLEGTGLCIRAGKQRAAVYYQRHVLPFIQSHPNLFPHGLDFQQFIHCGALVSAYSFTLENGVVMMPVADALNADGRDASNARLQQVDDGDGCWEMVVTRPVSKGEELLNFYGSFAESESLLRYGYISRTDTPGSAISVREIFQTLGRKGANFSLHYARLSVAMKSSAFVKAAPEGAEPFIDSGKVLPLVNLQKAYKKLDSCQLVPIIESVIADRLRLLKLHNSASEAGDEVTDTRRKLAMELRGHTIEHLESCLKLLNRLNSM